MSINLGTIEELAGPRVICQRRQRAEPLPEATTGLPAHWHSPSSRNRISLVEPSGRWQADRFFVHGSAAEAGHDVLIVFDAEPQRT